MAKGDPAPRAGEAAREHREAVRQEVRRFEAELQALLKGRRPPESGRYRHLGRAPGYARLAFARLRRLRGELEDTRQLEPHLRESMEELQRLSRITRRVHATLDIDELVRLLVTVAVDLLPTEGCIVYRHDAAERRYRQVVVHHLEEPALRALEYQLSTGVWDELGTDIVVLPEIATAAQDGTEERSLVVVPLHHRDERLGALVILSSLHRLSFFEHDMELLRLLSHAVSVAMANALLYQETKRLSITDDLTQLSNSRHLNEQLDRILKEAAEKELKVSLLFTDLDGFKGVNDLHGHRSGSAVLVEVAAIMRGLARPEDLVARFGGDEFVMVLPRVEAFKAFLQGEKLRAAIAGHGFLADRGLDARLTISIGVATYPDHARNAADLVARADEAMYSVKNASKDGVALAEER